MATKIEPPDGGPETFGIQKMSDSMLWASREKGIMYRVAQSSIQYFDELFLSSSWKEQYQI